MQFQEIEESQEIICCENVMIYENVKIGNFLQIYEQQVRTNSSSYIIFLNTNYVNCFNENDLVDNIGLQILLFAIGRIRMA